MKHKKKVLLVLLILIVSLSTLLLSVASFAPEKEITGNLFAIMLEEDDGSYYESDLEIFPDNYIYNAEKTYCVNGSVVNWDNTNKVANIKADGSEKCYIYFDKLFKDFTYTGNYQTYVASETGSYKIEAWGASRMSYATASYTSGYINLTEGEVLYVYVGEGGYLSSNGTSFNGGTGSSGGTPGGGATDIRLVSGEWYNATSINSRIMVAAGAGRGQSGDNTIAAGGGLIGYSGGVATGGTQTSLGTKEHTAFYDSKFGIANGGCPSGGGYYPGGGAMCASGSSSASSYISGHTGAVAITSASNQSPKSGCTSGTTNNVCSIHYSGKTFTNTVMIDGAGYNWTNVKGSQTAMPNPSGGTYALGVGHAGNGYARITLIK